MLSSDIQLKRVNHSDQFYGRNPTKKIEPQTTGQHAGPSKTAAWGTNPGSVYGVGVLAGSWPGLKTLLRDAGVAGSPMGKTGSVK